MSQPIYHVDAFSETPFFGNPAAVCPMSGPADEVWMQRVAQEMNLSETAFLHPERDGFRLRWFTPAVEVDLCGHATLASAHLLWETDAVPEGEMIRFHTRSGLLTASRDDGCIWLDFPAEPVHLVALPYELERGLGAPLRFVGQNRFDYLVELASEADVRALVPDMAKVASLPVRGVIVTALADADAGYDFVSRFFAPAAGLDEDPVTGSAHCALAPFWGARLERESLIGYQASSRGGVVRMVNREGRVDLGGKAVTVVRGELLGDPAQGQDT
ncbi:MAG: PhzF family phenazine biosynthesis protein [Leptospirillia bacterium]